MSDLDANHLLIVRRLEVVNEPFDHLIFHHGGLRLCSQLTPPLGIFQERLPTLLFYSHKDRALRSYFGVEPVVFQESIGHFPPNRGLFQSHIPCGIRANQTLKKNMAKQRMIIPIGSHLPTKHAQVHAKVSRTIRLDKLWCFELRRHNDLREVGQIVQINTSMGICISHVRNICHYFM